MSTITKSQHKSTKAGQAVLVSFVLVFFVLFITESGLAGSNLSDLQPDSTVSKSITPVQKADFTVIQQGKASFYAQRFHGRRTASGVHFDMDGFSAAHRTLPFGSILRVTNPKNNTSILVTVNDRGPFIRSRIIDLSSAAARSIDVALDKVTVEGFKPQDLNSGEGLLAFTSPSYEAFRVDSSTITIAESINSFSEAIRKHRLLSAKQPEKELLLVVVPNSTSGNLSYKYLLATRANEKVQEKSTPVLID